MNENVKVNLNMTSKKKTLLFIKNWKNALCKRIKIVEYAGFKFDIQ